MTWSFGAGVRCGLLYVNKTIKRGNNEMSSRGERCVLPCLYFEKLDGMLAHVRWDVDNEVNTEVKREEEVLSEMQRSMVLFARHVAREWGVRAEIANPRPL